MTAVAETMPELHAPIVPLIAHPNALSADTASAAIEVRGLTKRYEEFTAVDNLSFSVAPGELFGFLGPNGAGKSTTIKMLCTLLRPTAGAAFVNGFDVARYPSQVRES